MAKQPVFSGAATALVTPMNEDCSINYDKLKELIDWQIESGIDSLVICGTTGEASTLTDEEHIECIKAAVRFAKGNVPIIAGTGGNSTAHSVYLSKEAEKAGADAVLLVTPYYNKCTEDGLIAHYKSIAGSVKLPCILYSVPSRTAVTVTKRAAKELSLFENICGLKDAGGNFGLSAEIINSCGENLHLYSGCDESIVPLLSIGGKGVISVLSNILPLETHLLVTEYLKGNVKFSSELQIKLTPLIKALFCEVNPIPVKAALNLLGLNAGPLRLPLTEAAVSTKELVLNELKKLNII